MNLADAGELEGKIGKDKIEAPSMEVRFFAWELRDLRAKGESHHRPKGGFLFAKLDITGSIPRQVDSLEAENGLVLQMFASQSFSSASISSFSICSSACESFEPRDSERALTCTNSWHLRFTTGGVWILAEPLCIFLGRTSNRHNKDIGPVRAIPLFYLGWTCFRLNRISICVTLIPLLFFGWLCMCTCHIDICTDTYILALRIDLQWLMICNVYVHLLLSYISIWIIRKITCI